MLYEQLVHEILRGLHLEVGIDVNEDTIPKLCEMIKKRMEKANPIDAIVIPPEVREQLAEYAHNAWSGWMKYLFEKSIPYQPGKVQAKEGALIIPLWAVERWERQAETHYEDLPEDEKESDREEADRMLAIIKAV